MEQNLTKEHRRLLYLLYILTPSEHPEEVVWVKDLPLKALLYEGIIQGVFDWDYAPQSIIFHGKRKFINVSQEGEDDINDLREMGLVDKLRLSTSEHTHINAFKLSEKGQEKIDDIAQDDRVPVEHLINCPACKKVREAIVEKKRAYFMCNHCHKETKIDLLEIEDVPYVTEAYMPEICLLDEVLTCGN